MNDFKLREKAKLNGVLIDNEAIKRQKRSNTYLNRSVEDTITKIYNNHYNDEMKPYLKYALFYHGHYNYEFGIDEGVF